MVTVLRDIQERGRELEQVLTQYTQFVKPAFEEFCLPVSKSFHMILIVTMVTCRLRNMLMLLFPEGQKIMVRVFSMC